MDALLFALGLLLGLFIGFSIGALATKARSVNEFTQWFMAQVGERLEVGECYYLEIGKDDGGDDGEDEESPLDFNYLRRN